MQSTLNLLSVRLSTSDAMFYTWSTYYKYNAGKPDDIKESSLYFLIRCLKKIISSPENIAEIANVFQEKLVIGLPQSASHDQLTDAIKSFEDYLESIQNELAEIEPPVHNQWYERKDNPSSFLVHKVSPTVIANSINRLNPKPSTRY